MNSKDEITTAPVSRHFDAASAHKNIAIIELIRHLARISAENDYQAFLKSIEKRYSGSQPKGPLS